MLAVPKDWAGLGPNGKLDSVAMKNEANWWPFRWLKQIAHLPHQYDTFFAHGVTVPSGDPPKPFMEGSDLCGWMVFRPLLCPAAAQLFINDDLQIEFFALLALTENEMNLKLNQGLGVLTRALADGEVYTELLDPWRKSVV